jgi:hypothetical protein
VNEHQKMFFDGYQKTPFAVRKEGQKKDQLSLQQQLDFPAYSLFQPSGEKLANLLPYPANVRKH